MADAVAVFDPSTIPADLPGDSKLISQEQSSRIYMEVIEGQSVKEFIRSDPPTDAQLEVAGWIGQNLATLHNNDMIHGDLTTSNMMIRPDAKTITLIDFGLGQVKASAEDKGVDLYVLERAFSSTHHGSEAVFEAVLRAYLASAIDADAIEAKFQDVRQRGRKRVAFG